MQIDNPKAKKAIAEAMKHTDFDCADWEMVTLEAIALEILVQLGAKGMFVVTLL
jgi:hypothetical protein